MTTDFGGDDENRTWRDENGIIHDSNGSQIVDGAWLDAQTFPAMQWAIEGVVPEGFGLIVAPPKAGKSWMVAGFGLGCAGGGYALGKIPVKQRPVLYLALEDGHRRLQSRFRKLMEGRPIPAGIQVIIKAEPGTAMGQVAAWMDRNRDEAPLVMIDTLGRMKPPKAAGEESYISDYKFGSALKGLADDVPGSTVLVVHHTRKAESTDFIDAVSGTQGIAGAADFILVLARRRHSDEAVLSVTGRDVMEAEYALVMNDGRWTLDGMDLVDAAATAEKRREKPENIGDRSAEVLAYVEAHPGGVTPSEVDKALGMTASKVYLSRLFEAGRIEKPKRGTYTPVTSVPSVTDLG